MKFSIVVPVYNVEKYIDKCLKSIKEQSYTNFEVIIVNDGSPDNSQAIIDNYVKEDDRFKSLIKKNGGLSDARNYGLKYIKGNYLLFVDSDDYLDKDILCKLYEVLSRNRVDIVRFKCLTEDHSGVVLYKENYEAYENRIMEDVICELVTRTFVETACLYCYDIEFWKKYNFKYCTNRLHEDYGLIPLILYYTNTISSIDFIGYHYVQREGSITKENDYEKVRKKSFDTYYQYCSMVDNLKIEESSRKKEAILTYITECLIIKGAWLKGKDYKKYYRMLRKDRVCRNIATYNIKKKIKRIIASVSFRLYLIIFKNK